MLKGSKCSSCKKMVAKYLETNASLNYMRCNESPPITLQADLIASDMFHFGIVPWRCSIPYSAMP